MRHQLPSTRGQLRKFLHDLFAAAGLSEAGLDDVFAGAPDDVEPGILLRRVERAGVLPEEVDAEFLTDRFAIFRAHLEALFGYAAPRRYDGSVTLIRAAASPERYMDWSTVAGDVETHVLDGDHHSIWTGERLTELAGIVQRRLERA